MPLVGIEPHVGILTDTFTIALKGELYVGLISDNGM